MATSADIKRRARALGEKTNTESIGPVEVGNLIYDGVEYAEEVERNGGTLGIRKVYASVALMEADGVSPIDFWGKRIKKGNLVVVYDGTDAGVDNNKVYAFMGPGWRLVTGLDAGYATNEKLTELAIRLNTSPAILLPLSEGDYYLPDVDTLSIGEYGYYEFSFMIAGGDVVSNQILASIGNYNIQYWGIQINANALSFLYNKKNDSSAVIPLINALSNFTGKVVKVKIIKEKQPEGNTGGDVLRLYLNDTLVTNIQDWKEFNPDGVLSLGALYDGLLPVKNITFCYAAIWKEQNGNLAVYDYSTLSDVKKYGLSSDEIVLSKNAGLQLQDLYVTSKAPYLSFNTVNSKLRFEGYNGITAKEGRMDLLIKLPSDVVTNQLLFSYSNNLMVGVNNNALNIYNSEGGAITSSVPVSDYAEKISLISIRKKGYGYSTKLETYINNQYINDLTYTPQTNNTDVLDIASYDLSTLFCKCDFYFLRMYDTNGVLEWEVNANTIPDVYENVRLFIGATAINGEINTKTSYLDNLPAILYITSNKEYNLYIDNLIIDYSRLGLSLEVKGTINKVRSMDRSIRFNQPANTPASLVFNLYDSLGVLLDSKIVTLQVASPSAGSGTLQFLFVGDSTIDDALIIDGIPYYGHEGSQIVHEFHDMCNSNKGFIPLMIGHKKGHPPYYHAGMSGWSSSQFLNADSPFCYNGKNDFKRYVQKNITNISGAVDKVDFMIYQIGINDLKNESITVENLIDNVKTFINQFLADYPDAKIIIGMPPSGNDATGWSLHFFDISQFMMFRIKMIEYQKMLLVNFDNGVFHRDVYVCNAGQMIDRIYGFPYKLEAVSSRVSTQIMQHWDSVHPNQDGYNQMADGYFGMIKNLT